MKQIIIALALMIPAMSFAKVSDFNEMITENSNAQSQLHADVRGNLKMAQDEIQVRQRLVVVEAKGHSNDSFNAPTRKDMLAFKKEKVSHRPSEEKQFERLASELRLED